MSRPIPQPSQGDNSPCTHAYCIPTDTRHPRTVEGAVSSQLYPSTSSIASPYTSNGFKILHKTAASCRQCRDLPLRKPNAQLPGEIPARSSQANAAVKAHRPQPLTRNSTEVLMTPEESKVFVARSLTRELSQASGLGTLSAALSFVPPNFAKGMALKPYQCADVKRILSRESGEVVDGFKTNTGFIIGYEMG
ncbi:hypothetical protein BV25DRAFT_237234 [Artomyces pyxidatus]|uniref:Uncharacterized protein n=1 Tax=Artomyces pyxidatus TaxID=48021 RepID=A0ACB8T8F1_9AGAM|nr:hypothetical protein BV25DRAFT_237234 [Artomyces pyxidatus]